MATSLSALRDYVTAEVGPRPGAGSDVLLTVTHSNLRAVFLELRFDLHVRPPLTRLFARWASPPLALPCR